MVERLRQMHRPSSTITAAALAGMTVTACWACVDNFTAVEVSATVVSSTTTLASALIGYLKKENILKVS